MSQLKTDEDSLDWRRRGKRGRREKGQKFTLWVLDALSVLSEFNRPLPALEPTLQGLQTQPFPLEGPLPPAAPQGKAR